MIDIEREDILKASPDYEDYTENEASLTIDELKELSMAQKAKAGSGGGCSSGGCSSGGCSSGGCSSGGCSSGGCSSGGCSSGGCSSAGSCCGSR